MNKYKEILMKVEQVTHFGSGLSLLKLTSPMALPSALPGQFVNILPPPTANVLLRRPISICNINPLKNELWILVKDLGRGSKAICESAVGATLNIEFPLGTGFSTDLPKDSRLLLVGGGVGIAPLLFLGKYFHQKGLNADFILGGRRQADIPMRDEFAKYGSLYVTTEDGSYGEKGVVTAHPKFNDDYDMIFCCGPLPMMKAVAASAKVRNIACEVSLENKMACGIGACLCCVENTIHGNLCTCKHGPVFNINELTW